MIVEVIKNHFEEQWMVRYRWPGDRNWIYFESFDDKVKAYEFAQKVREANKNG